MLLLQICQLHLYDANLLFHHVPKVLFQILVTVEHSELCHVQETSLSLVISNHWCIILVDVASLVWGCCSAYLGCDELLLPFYHLKIVGQFSSDL